MFAITRSALCLSLVAIAACLLPCVDAAPSSTMSASPSLESQLASIGFDTCPLTEISLRPVPFVDLQFAQLFVQDDPTPAATYNWTLNLIRPEGKIIVTPSGVVSLNGSLPAPAILAFTVTATPLTNLGEIRTDSFSIEIK
ncbi:hypothetical protein HKX48_003816 [Thoreauomyces humboldtii]|nr:hypothetical protein HKX48_003816 [Thoreauomyces humboldtii]